MVNDLNVLINVFKAKDKKIRTMSSDFGFVSELSSLNTFSTTANILIESSV